MTIYSMREKQEQSLYDLEKYTFKNTYIDKLEKNTIS